MRPSWRLQSHRDEAQGKQRRKSLHWSGQEGFKEMSENSSPEGGGSGPSRDQHGHGSKVSVSLVRDPEEGDMAGEVPDRRAGPRHKPAVRTWDGASGG